MIANVVKDISAAKTGRPRFLNVRSYRRAGANSSRIGSLTFSPILRHLERGWDESTARKAGYTIEQLKEMTVRAGGSLHLRDSFRRMARNAR